MFLRVIFFLFIFTTPLVAQNIAICGDTSGYSYYPYHGLVKQGDSGMTSDAITGGKVTVKKLSQDEYDVLFAGSDGSIVSSKQDGGSVFLVLSNSSAFVFAIIYPGENAEYYSFWKEEDGKLKYSIQQARLGSPLIRKINLMIGSCTYIDFLN